MGRPELPVDHTVPARGLLAEALRDLRRQAGLTYDELAVRTGVSPATLKRAASGGTVPALQTAQAVAAACGRDPIKIGTLWRAARAADRGRLAQLRRPAAPELITTPAELSAALEYFYEAAGAPSLRLLARRAGGTHLLPVSSAGRIVNRQALPASRQQFVAYLTACGLAGRQLERWGDAFVEITVLGRTRANDTATWMLDYLMSGANGRISFPPREPPVSAEDPQVFHDRATGRWFARALPQERDELALRKVMHGRAAA
ncbi:helix-turn-helix domain-containing protein [Streptomyces sp. BF23-19]|uniref:helix-turn-helix domain-containing protein n=1 Tax=unclassified Streptomyces TaxID=2593676 RepID=UPI0034E4C0BC